MTLAARAGLVKFDIVDGAADSATAGLAIAAADGTAITTDDTIIACIELAQTTNAWTDRTASAAIIAGNKITVPDSANDKIAVFWLARNAGLQVDSPFIAAMLVAGSNTDAKTATGIAVGDTIIACIGIHGSTGAWTDRTTDCVITAADTITQAEDSSGETLLIIYMDQTGPRAFSALNLGFGIGTMDSSASSQPTTATITGIKVGDTPLVVLAVDETDYDALYELASYSSVSVDGTLDITSEPSPTATVGSKVLVLYQRANDPA
jgi:hypothetical protein